MVNNEEIFIERATLNLLQWHRFNPFRNATEGAFQGFLFTSLITCYMTICSDDPNSAFIVQTILLGILAGGSVGTINNHRAPRP